MMMMMMRFLLFVCCLLELFVVVSECCAAAVVPVPVVQPPVIIDDRKKCLHSEAPVSRPNGISTRAGSLKPGDEVWAFTPSLGVHISKVKYQQYSSPDEKRRFIVYETAT